MFIVLMCATFDCLKVIMALWQIVLCLITLMAIALILRKSVMWSNWLTVFNADGQYEHEKCNADAVGVVAPNVLVKETWDNDGWLVCGIIPGS